MTIIFKSKLFTGVLPLTILVSLMAITSKLTLVEFKSYSRSSIFLESAEELLRKSD